MRTSTILLACAAVVVSAAPLAAQTAPLPNVEEIFVRGMNGVEIQGRLIDLGRGAVSLLVDGTRRDIPIDAIATIQRRGDSVWNGALIGAAIGAGLWGIAAANGADVVPLVFGAAVGYGLLGAGLDAMYSGRTTISSRPLSADVRAGGRRAGMSVKFSF